MTAWMQEWIRANRYAVRLEPERQQVLIERPVIALDRIHALALLAWVIVLLEIDLEEVREAVTTVAASLPKEEIL